MAERMASSASTASRTDSVSTAIRSTMSKNGELTGTVELYGWQAKLLCNLGIFDLAGLLKRTTHDELSHVR